MNASHTQRQSALRLLQKQGMVRLAEFAAAGITAATIARMEKEGEVERIARGLYRIPDAPADAHHDLAVAARLVPHGVACLVSALAFHELTDTIPSRVWMAIGSKDRKPVVAQPALQFVRFRPEQLQSGVAHHVIEGVDVRITTPARTVVDLFRYRASAGRRFQKSPGINLALEGLREALRQRKAMPAEIAAIAEKLGVWKAMRPYLEAMTANA